MWFRSCRLEGGGWGGASLPSLLLYYGCREAEGEFCGLPYPEIRMEDLGDFRRDSFHLSLPPLRIGRERPGESGRVLRPYQGCREVEGEVNGLSYLEISVENLRDFFRHSVHAFRGAGGGAWGGRGPDGRQLPPLLLLLLLHLLLVLLLLLPPQRRWRLPVPPPGRRERKRKMIGTRKKRRRWWKAPWRPLPLDLPMPCACGGSGRVLSLSRLVFCCACGLCPLVLCCAGGGGARGGRGGGPPPQVLGRRLGKKRERGEKRQGLKKELLLPTWQI